MEASCEEALDSGVEADRQFERYSSHVPRRSVYVGPDRATGRKELQIGTKR